MRDGHPAETGSTGDSDLRFLSLADGTDRLWRLSSKVSLELQRPMDAAGFCFKPRDMLKKLRGQTLYKALRSP